MAKYLTFSIVVEFNDSINDASQKDEVAKKIAEGLANECRNGEGIAPDSSDIFTKVVYVKSVETDVEFISKV